MGGNLLHAVPVDDGGGQLDGVGGGPGHFHFVQHRRDQCLHIGMQAPRPVKGGVNQAIESLRALGSATTCGKRRQRPLRL